MISPQRTCLPSPYANPTHVKNSCSSEGRTAVRGITRRLSQDEREAPVELASRLCVYSGADRLYAEVSYLSAAAATGP